MSKPAIIVNKLGKSYRLGMQDNKADTFRDLLVDIAKAPLRRLRKLGEHDVEAEDAFWALKDISFEIQTGEVVGIIGRNGAGKSTLLKILSRITEPTKGEAYLHGRVSSLLEVGTGFHQELTGRENIFLNGSILGMRKDEIKSKFDEIVAFSEIEKFLDTPVKRYSSGMYVRLAFAVAAHLEPEIMIVDEVLAVGDLEFQKKCLKKMGDVASEGRTVLIVSHNMSAIQSLCGRAILLQKGNIVRDGKVAEVIKEYLENLERGAENPFENNPDRKTTGAIQFIGAKMLDKVGNNVSRPISGEPLIFEFEYNNNAQAKKVEVFLTIYNHFGVAVTNISTLVSGVSFVARNSGFFYCAIKKLPLPLGEYRVAAAISINGKIVDHIPNILKFNISVSSFYCTGSTPDIQYSACMIENDWFDKFNINI